MWKFSRYERGMDSWDCRRRCQGTEERGEGVEQQPKDDTSEHGGCGRETEVVPDGDYIYLMPERSPCASIPRSSACEADKRSRIIQIPEESVRGIK